MLLSASVRHRHLLDKHRRLTSSETLPKHSTMLYFKQKYSQFIVNYENRT